MYLFLVSEHQKKIQLVPGDAMGKARRIDGRTSIRTLCQLSRHTFNDMNTLYAD
ncbi:MAG TPA: hypothetical protein VK463_19030 [Desulfomonilaceae bacterium]|nr:hypothetical protein [Desulfomonilaceae bacterium]